MFLLNQGHFSGPATRHFTSPSKQVASAKYCLRYLAGPWGEIASRPRGRRGYQLPQLPHVSETMIEFGYAGLEDSSVLRYSLVLCPMGWFNGIQIPFSFRFRAVFK